MKLLDYSTLLSTYLLQSPGDIKAGRRLFKFTNKTIVVNNNDRKIATLTIDTNLMTYNIKTIDKHPNIPQVHPTDVLDPSLTIVR